MTRNNFSSNWLRGGKPLLAAGMLLFVSTATSFAQKSNGYLVGAPGFASGFGGNVSTFRVAVGGEGYIGKGFGVGAEIGGLSPVQEPSAGFGLLSANAYYHLRAGRSSTKWDPFLTAGYSLAMGGDGSANMFNFGGGVTYWVKRHLGIRLEVRDHVGTVCCGEAINFVGVGFGIAF